MAWTPPAEEMSKANKIEGVTRAWLSATARQQNTKGKDFKIQHYSILWYTIVYCSILQYTVVNYSILQYTIIYFMYSILQLTLAQEASSEIRLSKLSILNGTGYQQISQSNTTAFFKRSHYKNPALVHKHGSQVDLIAPSLGNQTSLGHHDPEP